MDTASLGEGKFLLAVPAFEFRLRVIGSGRRSGDAAIPPYGYPLLYMAKGLAPFCWVEPCLCGGQPRHVLYEVLGCPHASDYTADAFLVANPVVLETLWSGGEFGRFHALYPYCPNE